MKKKLTDPSIAGLISNFQNIPKSELRVIPKNVPKMDVTMERIMSKFQIESPGIDQIIMKNWHIIMGTQLAHRCSPEKITKDKVLLIRVGSSTLKSELQFRKRKIVNTIHTLLGSEEIADVRFQF